MDLEIKQQLLKLDRPVPRYTSYPTAPHFQPLKDKVNKESVLLKSPVNGHLSLYLHIPFCSKLCWFCGCHTKITKRYSPVEDYLQLLLREIELKAEIYAANNAVTNIHFGGGSPTILNATDFGALMSKLRSKFTISNEAEISIEIDPRQVSEAKIATYAKLGVTRASIGVQDFDENVLKAVNRPQPFFATYETMKLLRIYGINNINIDLMYGLPFQTKESIIKTAEQTILLQPDQIALFGYAHVPWLKKHMRMMLEKEIPDSSQRLDLFEAASSIFKGAGYIQVGIDHFSKPHSSLHRALSNHSLMRNFQGYTDDRNEVLLGFGISAISGNASCYMQNFSDMAHYRECILNGQIPLAKSAILSKEDKLRRDVIESIMCYLAVDTRKIALAHGFDADYFKHETDSLEKLDAAQLFSIDNGVVRVKTPQITRIICSAFDAYLQPHVNQTPRHVTST